ncbi:hypothetical protein ABVT39_022495 [Epinephelus coioides]
MLKQLTALQFMTHQIKQGTWVNRKIRLQPTQIHRIMLQPEPWSELHRFLKLNIKQQLKKKSIPSSNRQSADRSYFNRRHDQRTERHTAAEEDNSLYHCEQLSYYSNYESIDYSCCNNDVGGESPNTLPTVETLSENPTVTPQYTEHFCYFQSHHISVMENARSLVIFVLAVVNVNGSFREFSYVTTPQDHPQVSFTTDQIQDVQVRFWLHIIVLRRGEILVRLEQREASS